MSRAGGVKRNDYHVRAAAPCQPARFPQDLVMRHPLRPAAAGRPCPAFADPPPRRLPAMITVGLSTLGFCSLGMLAAMFSALAFYAASPHCRWPRLRRAGRLGRQIGLVAAAAALWLWMAELGFAAGLVAMLCTWMLAAMLLPALAAWHRPGTRLP